jgi:hypothetical protein
MLFIPRTQIYTVHINPSKAHPVENAIFVREGFNFIAFLFGFIWALYNRMWWELAFILIVITLFGAAEEQRWLSISSLAILQFMFNLFVGFQANDWHRAALSRRGYVMSDIVVSEDKLHAQQRYYDRVLAA